MKNTYPGSNSFLKFTSLIKCSILLFLIAVFTVNIATAQCGPGTAVQVATAPTGASDPSWATMYQNVIGMNPINTVTNNSGNGAVGFTSDGFLLPNPTAREADFGTPTWQAQWTPTTLYILVTVPDLTVNFDPIPNDQYFYNYDAVEVYLSGSNAHAAPPYGADDVQYGFSNGVYRSGGAGTSTTGVSGTSVVTPGVGYTMFITIPLASFSSPTAMNSQVSFDVAIDDNDHTPNILPVIAADSAFLTTAAGGSYPPTAPLPSAQSIAEGYKSGGDWRDSQVAWNSKTGDAPYSTTSDLGNLKLTAPPTPTVPISSSQIICGSGVITLAGASPTVGSGVWTATGGLGNLTQLSGAAPAANNPTPFFTPLLGIGTYVFTWTISNSFCTAMQSVSADDTIYVKAVVTPTFNPLPDLCTGATAPILPTTSTNSVPITGTWTPMPVDNLLTGTYTFIPTAGLCANFATLTQTILPATITPTFAALADVCTGSVAPPLPAASLDAPPITGTWSPATINTTVPGTYTFTPTPGQCALTTTLTQAITIKTVPVFTALPAICTGATAPILLTTSTNGITGTWNPATVSNTTTGTYTFTPTAGLCATIATLVQTINPATITPTFTALPVLCKGSVVPVLSGSSTNVPPITGTWSPAAISNTATGTYTFTPAPGQCALTTTIVQTINNPVTPAFTPLPAICTGATPPILSGSSTDAPPITGTWNPATVSNTVTKTYTFTPTAGQCATTTSLTQTIKPATIIPAFTPLPAICTGATPPILPSSSTDAPPITGTWNPATVSNITTGTYTFTPAIGQCAITTSITQIINPPSIVPTFAALPGICSGSTPPILPGSSTNIPPITGTWSPATVSNTTTGTYTFTPATGQCGLTTTIVQTIIPSTILPTFTALPALCTGSVTPVLPTTSNNGIAGTWNPMPVDNTLTGTYTFTPSTGLCATPATLVQTINPKVIPTFAALPAICMGSAAPALPATSTNAIPGTWSPTTVDNTTTATYTFTPAAGQCALTTTIVQTVNSGTIVPTFTALPAICNGSIAPILSGTSTNGITGSWSPSTVDNTITATYTFTPVAGQCATSTTTTQTVNNPVTPAFAALPAMCTGATSPVIPTTSTNGITGTWNPGAVSNTATATYTFTPDAGQCGTTTTIIQTVNIATIIPTFAALSAICNGSLAPVLSTASINSITGAWSPATVSNTVTGTYTFTPATGQCALTTSIIQTITSPTPPTFAALSAICNSSISPVLSTTSTNGITGVWNPATVDNTTTATYTFTPDPGQCATTTTLSQTVNSNILPTFTALTAICNGNITPALSTTSTNAITGTWNPATVDNTASATYTFTPTAGLCATTTTLSQTVNPNILPTFTALAAICNGATAPTLLTTSTNAITGTWNPATIDNTASATYTFTPTAGLCATTATLSQTVNPNILPTFTALAAICNGATAPTLLTTSTNAITGTWNPATIDNTASATYTFTPTAGLCAVTTTLSQTVNPNILPTFTALAAICSGATAPTLLATSTNAITGTWNPATVDNTATATYTFTPSAGLCALTTTLSQTVNSNVLPTFTALTAICNGATAPTLLTTSTNAITGTWNPATIDNTATATYTFTPTAGLCAITTTLSQTVSPNILPTFTMLTAICDASVAPILSTTANNGITGTWNPATVDNTTSATYTFTPTAGLCAVTTTLSQTVNPNILPTFTVLAPICNASAAPVLSTTANNGITGTWNPTTVDNTTSATYTFTPTAGLCALTTTLDQTIIPNVLPAFTALTAICNGSTAAVLANSSTNVPAITGTWNPSTVSNTETATYTFTPTAGLCALTTTLTQTVNPNVLPTFTALPGICSGTATPALPTTSVNGITGTWNPIPVNNTATATYTFTPTAGLCALTTTLSQTVNPTPVLIIQRPNDKCSPATVDITDPSVAIDNSILPPTTVLSYYTDPAATVKENSPEALDSGTYYIQAITSFGCADTVGVAVVIYTLPLPPTVSPVRYCEGDIAAPLTATADGSNTLVWYNALTGGSAYPSVPTPATAESATYYVAQQDIHCQSTRTALTVQVTAKPKVTVNPGLIEQYSEAGPNGQDVTLNGTATGFSEGATTVTWNTSDFSPIAITEQTTTLAPSVIQPLDTSRYYFIGTSVENTKCADTASVLVQIVQHLVIPNIFSPNGDGVNDVWDIKNIQEFGNVEVSIFNRYGQFIYKSNDGYKTPWDGTYHGNPVPVGTYFYIIKTSLDKDPISGYVAVVR